MLSIVTGLSRWRGFQYMSNTNKVSSDGFRLVDLRAIEGILYMSDLSLLKGSFLSFILDPPGTPMSFSNCCWSMFSKV